MRGNYGTWVGYNFVMRVALNAMQVRAAKSGVGQYIHALTEAMLPLVEAGGDTLRLYTSRQNCGNYRYENAPGGFENFPWGLDEGRKGLRLLNEYANFPRELKSWGADLVHGLSNFLPVRKVCPSVLTLHDLSYYVHPERCPLARRLYWYAMTARSVALADEIITDSESSRRDIERFFPKCRAPLTVIPLAAHGRFRPLGMRREECAAVMGAAGRSPYFLYVGTLEPGKNVARLIRAFDAVADEFPEHLLLMTGDRGWLTEPIFQEAQRARHADRMKFLGHITDDAVVELMNHCAAFVFPSLYEGFGLPPLEAMSCGAPVITSRCSSLPEVTGEDAALLVNPESEHEIAAAMRAVVSDRDKADVLRGAGLERARRFSWEKTAQETWQVYERVLRVKSEE